LSGDVFGRFEDSFIVQELSQSVENTEFVVFLFVLGKNHLVFSPNYKIGSREYPIIFDFLTTIDYLSYEN